MHCTVIASEEFASAQSSPLALLATRRHATTHTPARRVTLSLTTLCRSRKHLPIYSVRVQARRRARDSTPPRASNAFDSILTATAFRPIPARMDSASLCHTIILPIFIFFALLRVLYTLCHSCLLRVWDRVHHKCTDVIRSATAPDFIIRVHDFCPGRFRLAIFGLALCTSSYAFVVLAPSMVECPGRRLRKTTSGVRLTSVLEQIIHDDLAA